MHTYIQLKTEDLLELTRGDRGLALDSVSMVMVQKQHATYNRSRLLHGMSIDRSLSSCAAQNVKRNKVNHPPTCFGI